MWLSGHGGDGLVVGLDDFSSPSPHLLLPFEPATIAIKCGGPVEFPRA